MDRHRKAKEELMSGALDWSDRHRLMRIAANADQAEKEAIRLGNAAVATGFDDEKAAGVLDDETPETGLEPEWEGTEEVTEHAEGEAIAEIECRQKMLGDYYPFRLKGAGIAYTPSTTGIYEFCLAASLANDALSKKELNKLTTLFELVATQVVRAYLGDDAEAIRTGWPSHDPEQRPVRFKQMFGIVAKRTGEWRWDPSHPNPNDPHPRQVKDEGVDFVVWKPMPDQRPGKLFVLGQCACGNDWDNKCSELNAKRLERWFRPATVTEFQRAFVLPRTISATPVFQQFGNYAGLIFDRARMVAIAEKNAVEFSHWKAQLLPLTQTTFTPNVD
jgi:hypothetical protein